MKVIIYPQENNQVAVMAPSGVLSVEDTAKKDVPVGLPYIIIDASELPPSPQEAWVADFNDPDGEGGAV